MIKDVIAKVACKSDKCQFRITNQTSTLLALAAGTFDKRGIYKIGYDPNIYTYDVNCLECKKSWKVEERDNHIEVINKCQ